jgi:steroid 5-alpha reductase family enzyme
VADHPRKRKQRGAPSARERMERGYAKAETIGAVISALIAVSIVVGYLAGTEVNGEKPRFVQVLAPALLMGVMAWGMWRARYWAVLGFQLILVFLIFSAVYGLALQAATVGQVLATLALLAVAGSFFYFMVKAMARIQMPTRE